MTGAPPGVGTQCYWAVASVVTRSHGSWRPASACGGGASWKPVYILATPFRPLPLCNTQLPAQAGQARGHELAVQVSRRRCRCCGGRIPRYRRPPAARSRPDSTAEEVAHPEFLLAWERMGVKYQIIDPIPDTNWTTIPGGRSSWWGALRAGEGSAQALLRCHDPACPRRHVVQQTARLPPRQPAQARVDGLGHAGVPQHRPPHARARRHDGLHAGVHAR